MGRNTNKPWRCSGCGTAFKSHIQMKCCTRHRNYCQKCAVREHINDDEHQMALSAKAKFEFPSVKVRVR